MNKDQILQSFNEFKKNDIAWRKGRLWSYVYFLDKEVEEIGKWAYNEFLTENGIDVTAFPSLRIMENEVIRFSKSILRGGDDAVGSMTTGGTESIILAVKAARDRAKFLNPNQTEFEMIVAETVHAAFYKAAHYLGVKAIPAKVNDETLKATPELIAPLITPNTILIAASAVSYAWGILDDIEGIGKLASEKNIPFHVDGCIGAFILSTARLGGKEIPNFDFSVPGVTSMSMDLHKYGYCPKGASVVIYKNEEYRKFQFYVCNDWTGYTFANTGILSSKSGGPIAAAWAVTNFIGIERYKEVALKTIKVADKIRAAIHEIPELVLQGDSQYSLLSFTTRTKNVYELVDLLHAKGWHVGVQFKFRHMPSNIHLTVAAHHFENYTEFISDLKECVANLSNEPASLPFDPSQLGNVSLPEMLTNLGISADKMPDKMAPINTLIEVMPKEVTKELVAGLMMNMMK